VLSHAAKTRGPLLVLSDSPLIARQIEEIDSHFDFVSSVADRFSFGEMLQWKPWFFTSLDFTAQAPHDRKRSECHNL